MRQLLYQTLTQLGLPRAASMGTRKSVTILMYHGFTDRTAHDGSENYQGLHQNIEMFRRHLEYLRDQYHVVPLEAVAEHYQRGTALPPHAAVITMDDGYRSNYTLAFPLLRQLGLPASIFLATGFVHAKRFQWTNRVEYAVDHAQPAVLSAFLGQAASGDDPRAMRGRALVQIKSRLKQIAQEQRDAQVDQIEQRLGCSLSGAPEIPAIYQPLDWDEVREMHASGLVSFGSHTDAHFILSRCTPDVVRQDLQTAKRIIEDNLGAPCPLFCYPNGRRGDFDQQTRSVVAEVGHTCALTTVVGFNDASADVYELRRVGVLDGQSFEEFVMTLAGVTGLMMRLGDGLRRVGLRN